MRVRFLRHYQTYRRGREYDLGAGVARSMLQMGICEPCPADLFETAIAPQQQEEAVAPVARKRGRPRKKKVQE